MIPIPCRSFTSFGVTIASAELIAHCGNTSVSAVSPAASAPFQNLLTNEFKRRENGISAILGQRKMARLKSGGSSLKVIMEGQMRRFAGRTDAGRVLAEALEQYRFNANVIVLALPRGGVPVAAVIAEHLHVPLDIFLVRKLGCPGHEEFAIGAIASGGVRVLNPAAFRMGEIPEDQIDAIAAREEIELNRRDLEYRGDRPHPKLEGRIVILVDDGLATGSTMRAAVSALRQQNPAKIIVAVPVASADACELLSREADEVLCASIPEPFHAVGLRYEDFAQTSDAEVKELLDRSEQLSHTH